MIKKVYHPVFNGLMFDYTIFGAFVKDLSR